METKTQPRGARALVGLLVGVCFLLGSTGWLSWLYRVASLVGPSEADFHTMVLGYLAQVLGLGAYMLARARLGGHVATRAALASVVLYVMLLEPATMSGGTAATLGFGYAMNVLCGYVQGHYLTCLAELVEPRGRGVVFGAGYAASTLATWLLSGVADGMLTVGVWNLATCVMLALAALACIWLVDRLLLPGTALQVPAAAETEAPGAAAPRETSGGGEEITTGPAPWCSAAAPDRSLLILAGVSVVVMSLVKNVGFSFPTADLSGVVDLEMSRLFYGVGLVVGGIAADVDRRYAFVCCAASLAVPFLMLALEGAGVSSFTLWVLGYLLFGFFSVFRVVLFADLATQVGRPALAGGGLMLGRVGDVLGTLLCLACASSAVTLVAVSSVAFVVAFVLMFLLFERMYGGVALPGASGAGGAGQGEREAGADADGEVAAIAAFAVRHGLSEREREVLPLVVRRLTNARIAEELFITEATVKYHVRNILKKTGCANRVEVIGLYDDERGSAESGVAEQRGAERKGA